jgi:hypothetical protein
MELPRLEKRRRNDDLSNQHVSHEIRACSAFAADPMHTACGLARWITVIACRNLLLDPPDTLQAVDYVAAARSMGCEHEASHMCAQGDHCVHKATVVTTCCL